MVIVLLFLLISGAVAQVPYPFVDGFESGTISSNWTIGSGTYTRSVTTATKVSGNYSLTQSGGSSTHDNGLSLSYPSGIKPENISFSVRAGNTTSASTYFVLKNGSSYVIFFYMSETGYMYVNSSTYASKTYLANTWYNVRMKINWTNYTLDVYIDNVLTYTNVPFLTQLAVTKVCLYNYHTLAQAWYDDIAIGTSAIDSTKIISLLPVSSPTFNRRPILRWNTNDSVTTYKITADLSNSFSTPLFTIPITDTFYQPTVNFPFDTIYWKVESMTDNRFTSGVSSFIVADSVQPVLSATPLSLKSTSGDTSSHTLSICNSTGKKDLSYTFYGLRDSSNILVWSYVGSTSSTRYINLTNAIRQYNSKVAISTFSSLDSSALRTALANKDVFLLPYPDLYTPTTIHGQTFKKVLSDFTNRGGTIVSIYAGSYANFFTGAELVSLTYYSYTSSSYAAQIKSLSHPLFSNVTSLSTVYYTSYFSAATADTAFILAKYSSYGIVLEKQINQGKVVLLGSDFYTPDSSWSKLIGNATKPTLNSLPTWLKLSTDSGTVAIGACSAVTVKFNPTLMKNGTYTTNVGIWHNSPTVINPFYIPCTLIVPQPTMSISKTSLNSSVNTGDSVAHSLSLTNTGLSRLEFSATTNASWIHLANSNGSMSKDSTFNISVRLTAASMIYNGKYVDSVRITHNASNLPSPITVRCSLTVISNIPTLINYTPDPTSDRKPLLRWHNVATAESYTIQISTAASFASPMLVQPTADTFYLPVVNLPIGKIHWRVKSDLNTTYSLADSFLIQTDSIPTIILVSPDTITNRRPTLTWKSAKGASVYQIQIDTAGTFTTPWLSAPVGDTFFTPPVNLPLSKICWRISNTDYSANAYSAVDTFFVRAIVSVENEL
ncbi:MAG: hypothetical protein JNL74_23355, partial [Fibrobacteres bacterium]|nr:hypothetical protein [Fibrobacterota bacterium]